jgi:hypothetical protein
MSGFSDFSLGAKVPILQGGKTRWKPQKGKFRLSFVALPGIETKEVRFVDGKGLPTIPLFSAAKRLYAKDVGYFVLPTDEPEAPYIKLAGGGIPKTSIATTVVFWPTDANGTLDKARFANGEFEVNTWVFSLEKYRQFEALNAEFPLSHHDLSVTVTDPQFHKMNFAPCKESLLKTICEKKSDLFNTVMENASPIHANLRQDIGQDLTLDQIREKMSGSVGSPSSGNSSFNSSFDADDILDGML